MSAKTALQQSLPITAFALTGFLAMGISALHLGSRMRIYRSVLNLRGSWVSREVLLFGLFFAATCLLGLLGIGSHWTGWIIAITGLGALLSMDMVYRIRGQKYNAVPHSAMATLTALFLIGLLTGEAVLASTAAVVKLSLYLQRWFRDRSRYPVTGSAGITAGVFGVATGSVRIVTGFIRIATGSVRIIAGLLLPFLLWLSGLEAGSPWLVGSALLGEAIDRAQFYSELQFLTPRRQMEIDLERFAQRADPAA
jgi:DMSO reductase anchor subunit